MLDVPRLEALTRIGFAARGVMYILIGVLALRSGRTEDGAGALATLSGGSGSILLAIMALGFLGYGLWRLSEAAVDSENHGNGAGGLAIRAGGAVSGAIHLLLCGLAASMALGSRAASGGDGTQESAAATLDLPGGELLLLVAGAALLVTGLVQLGKALRAGFLRHLDGRAAGRPWVKALGRAGYAARGIVFLLIGCFLLKAAVESDAGEAGGMADALDWLSPDLRTAVAAGLLLFGLFSLVEARYRRINDPKVIDRLRRHASRRAH